MPCPQEATGNDDIITVLPWVKDAASIQTAMCGRTGDTYENEKETKPYTQNGKVCPCPDKRARNLKGQVA